MGVKIHSQYVALITCDFVNILEAPINEDVSRFTIERGAIETLHTMNNAAMEVDDFFVRID